MGPVQSSGCGWLDSSEWQPKYGEAVLAVKYRVKDANGQMAGGPMYYLEHGLKQKWLGVLFAIFGALAAFGIGNGTQAKAVADVMTQTFSVPHWITGVALVILAGSSYPRWN